jgi:hypothetical protein
VRSLICARLSTPSERLTTQNSASCLYGLDSSAESLVDARAPELQLPIRADIDAAPVVPKDPEDLPFHSLGTGRSRI